FKLFEKGKSLEDIEWQRDGEFFRFKSSLRKRPAVEVVDDAFIDGLLRELGIYLPPCYPVVSGGGKAWLAAEEKSIGAIERADLVELENEFEDEEEDED
ncbi:MAG TPA: hypothetical protein VHH88_04960, partial [Verrucomicrobiae bacterium]|nr:hypothetical protein [Verrucomicrobiae bacterium]